MDVYTCLLTDIGRIFVVCVLKFCSTSKPTHRTALKLHLVTSNGQWAILVDVQTREQRPCTKIILEMCICKCEKSAVQKCRQFKTDAPSIVHTVSICTEAHKPRIRYIVTVKRRYIKS